MDEPEEVSEPFDGDLVIEPIGEAGAEDAGAEKCPRRRPEIIGLIPVDRYRLGRFPVPSQRFVPVPALVRNLGSPLPNVCGSRNAS